MSSIESCNDTQRLVQSITRPFSNDNPGQRSTLPIAKLNIRADLVTNVSKSMRQRPQWVLEDFIRLKFDGKLKKRRVISSPRTQLRTAAHSPLDPRFASSPAQIFPSFVGRRTSEAKLSHGLR